MQSTDSQHVNSLINSSVKPGHSPAPCAVSVLNTLARESPTSSATSEATLVHHVVQIPWNWPHDVVYITQNLVASSIPDSIAQRYVLPPLSSTSSPPAGKPIAAPSSLPRATHNDGRPDQLYTTSIQTQVPLAILPIDKLTPWCPESFHSTSRNLTHHPAAGSHGLFAAHDILPDTFIRPYLGVLHSKKDADFHSTYDLSLCHDPRLSSTSSPDVESQLETISIDSDTDRTALYLDSRWWGNESRFVNDYRGIAAKPNVEFRSFIQLHQGQDRFQMGLFATRPIKRGQELLINYGKSFWLHFEQLDELKSKALSQAASNDQVDRGSKDSEKPAQQSKSDPIQAMLQRSRLRIAKQAPRQAPHT